MRLTRLVPVRLARGVPDCRDGARAEAGRAGGAEAAVQRRLPGLSRRRLGGRGRRPVGRGAARQVRRIHPRAGRASPAWTATRTWRRRPSFPHAEKLAPVDVRHVPRRRRRALYDASVHAEARRAQAQSVAAACKDCHGTHEIRPVKDPDSPTYHLNLPATCGRCHGNAEIIRKGRIAIGDVVAQFQDSIHGQALAKSGLTVAPNCRDCHNAHDIRRRTDPASPVFRTIDPGDVRQVPRGGGAAIPGRRARRRAGQGPARRAGVRDLPLGAPDPADRGGHVEGAGARRVRRRATRSRGRRSATPSTARKRSSASCAWRRAPTATARTTSSPKRDARSTVSTARLVSTCRKCHAGARTRASRSTTRTPTGTTTRATRCSSTRRSSWRRC